jgi:transcriptional regulator with XRE-family HTH domain
MAKKQQTRLGRGRRGLGHVDADVGARLRQYRLRAGLSQESLGARVGVTFQQIQKYENGSNAIATTRLPSICAALNIAPNDLYGTLYTNGEIPTPAPQLSSFAAKLALAIDGLSKGERTAVAGLVHALTGRKALE